MVNSHLQNSTGLSNIKSKQLLQLKEDDKVQKQKKGKGRWLEESKTSNFDEHES